MRIIASRSSSSMTGRLPGVISTLPKLNSPSTWTSSWTSWWVENRLGMGFPSQSTCVRALDVLKPTAPAAIPWRSRSFIRPTSSAVASRSSDASPMT